MAGAFFTNSPEEGVFTGVYTDLDAVPAAKFPPGQLC